MNMNGLTWAEMAEQVANGTYALVQPLSSDLDLDLALAARISPPLASRAVPVVVAPAAAAPPLLAVPDPAASVTDPAEASDDYTPPPMLFTVEPKDPSESSTSTAQEKLSASLIEFFQPPIVRLEEHLKELIDKQNKIQIDLAEERREYSNHEMTELHDMMNNVKIYREKLVKIKKQMQNIYQRTKVLKKRAANIQACKQKELQRKLQKQQQEESLIGKVL